MTLNESGFLSPDIQRWVTKHRGESAEGFRIAEDLNRIAVKALYATAPAKDDRRQLLVALLFARALSHYQCALVLAERGAGVQARVLIRVMCEAVFFLVSCVNDVNFVSKYVNDDRRRQLRMIEALLGIAPEDNAVPAAELEELRVQADELRAGIKADKLPRLTAFDTAQRAGLLDFYRLFYVPYSNPVHSAVRDLDSHITKAPDGSIASLTWGPDSSEVDDLVDAAIQNLFAAAHAVLQIFPQPEVDSAFESMWGEQKARLRRKTDERQAERAAPK